MPETKYDLVEKICRNPDCQKKYEAKVANCLSVPMVLGGGYCPECREKFDQEAEARDKMAREAWIMSTRRKWRQTSGIPVKFMNEEFSTFIADRDKMETNLKDTYKTCWEYANGFDASAPAGYKSLALFSEHSNGVGKTHLVCAIGHRVLDCWKGDEISNPIRFISEPDLYIEIQETYRQNFEGSKSEASIIRELIRVPLLIIDDVGKRQVHDKRFVQRIMFSIIDGRYRATLPIVLTANLKPYDLAVYLSGERSDKDTASMDRLLEMCGVFYQIDGESYRWEKANE